MPVLADDAPAPVCDRNTAVHTQLTMLRDHSIQSVTLGARRTASATAPRTTQFSLSSSLTSTRRSMTCSSSVSCSASNFASMFTSHAVALTSCGDVDGTRCGRAGRVTSGAFASFARTCSRSRKLTRLSSSPLSTSSGPPMCRRPSVASARTSLLRCRRATSLSMNAVSSDTMASLRKSTVHVIIHCRMMVTTVRRMTLPLLMYAARCSGSVLPAGITASLVAADGGPR
mmetsp:Transcript_15170/g.37546  ORF Transcript_15170/g.37546 Transcript_15170/m.37546 type:complete len:229 (-) Transcript_15170:572-1258(-)